MLILNQFPLQGDSKDRGTRQPEPRREQRKALVHWCQKHVVGQGDDHIEHRHEGQAGSSGPEESRGCHDRVRGACRVSSASTEPSRGAAVASELCLRPIASGLTLARNRARVAVQYA